MIVPTLFAQGHLESRRSYSACRGDKNDPDLERAIVWLDAHFPVGFPAGHFEWLEPARRAAVRSGSRRFRGIDWFEQGAKWLLQNQNANGSWGNGVFDTGRALNFLGTRDIRIVFDKLDYHQAPEQPSSTWNERPNDARNFSHWMGPQFCSMECGWQRVNFSTPIEDLLDAPILYISGNGGLNFAKADLAKLRDYVARGGLIVGNADCKSEAFSRSFKALGLELFPAYEFRELPLDHLIFTGEQWKAKKWKLRQNLFGMSNGVRELMLLFPESDPGRSFESRSDQSQKESFQAMGNVVRYALGRTFPRTRDELSAGPAANAIVPERQISLARLAWNGNWDPEPASWFKLNDFMIDHHKTDVHIENVKLGTDPLGAFHLAHLTGTGLITLDDKQRKDLTDFVKSGGTLIIDAAGGDHVFGDATAGILTQLFGDAAKNGLAKPLPAERDVYNVESNPMERVRYRRASALRLGRGPKEPNICGIEIEQRIAVLFSREDLSAGLVGATQDGIDGYEPSSAIDLMSRLILYGAKSHAR